MQCIVHSQDLAQLITLMHKENQAQPIMLIDKIMAREMNKMNRKSLLVFFNVFIIQSTGIEKWMIYSTL